MKTMVSAQLSDAFCGAVIGNKEVLYQCKNSEKLERHRFVQQRQVHELG